MTLMTQSQEKNPLAIGNLNHSVSSAQNNGITFLPKNVKFILKRGEYAEILDVEELLITRLKDRNGFAFPMGSLVEISFDPPDL